MDPRLLIKGLKEVTKYSSLSFGRKSILDILIECPSGHTVKELCKTTSTSCSSMQAQLAYLIKNDFVYKAPAKLKGISKPTLKHYANYAALEALLPEGKN